MTFHDLFGGLGLFGIADLEALSRRRAQVESHYDAPLSKGRGMYDARRCISSIGAWRCVAAPGSGRPGGPANQAEMMFAALRGAGVPCAYIGYPGEQHGFREAANIARTLEAQLYFFATVTDMTLAESIEPVEILNL